MKSKIVLALMLTLAIGLLTADMNIVIFRNIVAHDDTTETLKLVLQEFPDYPVTSENTPREEQLIIQLYKDGGDGIINPLDEQGNPTGDDVMITNPVHNLSKQGLFFKVPFAWLMNVLVFNAPDEEGEAWQGDSIYLRIFNSTSIETATKYLVSHTLFQIPSENTTVNYTPDYGWDARGWFEFRKIEE